MSGEPGQDCTLDHRNHSKMTQCQTLTHPGIELSRLGTLESEKLHCHPGSLERWVQNGEWLGEYVGLHREKFDAGTVIACALYSCKPCGNGVCRCRARLTSLHRLIICSGWVPHEFFTEYGHCPMVDAILGCISECPGSIPRQFGCDGIESRL